MSGSMYLSPSPVQQFTDDNGALLVGGQLFCYLAGTTTKQAAFTDSTGDTALPNPIILNARGEVAPSATGTSCGLWLDPTLAYKFVLAPSTDTDPPTNPFWTIDEIVSPQSTILAALQQYESSLTGVPIGGMLAFGGATIPAGFLLCYGQAVSRTTYSVLYAVIGIAYGSGDGSTTFNLPDKRGRVSIGADNMGGSPANRVTEGVSGVDGSTVGASGGSQNAQQDTLTASTTVTAVTNDPGHKHWQYYTGSFPGSGVPEGGVSNAVGPGTQSPDMQTASTATGVTISVSAATTVTSELSGSSQNVQPTEVDNWIIYTGVFAA
jgi:microcystin-dependent protein